MPALYCNHVFGFCHTAPDAADHMVSYAVKVYSFFRLRIRYQPDIFRGGMRCHRTHIRSGEGRVDGTDIYEYTCPVTGIIHRHTIRN